jgi:hypothetical protein
MVVAGPASSLKARMMSYYKYSSRQQVPTAQTLVNPVQVYQKLTLERFLNLRTLDKKNEVSMMTAPRPTGGTHGPEILDAECAAERQLLEFSG